MCSENSHWFFKQLSLELSYNPNDSSLQCSQIFKLTFVYRYVDIYTHVGVVIQTFNPRTQEAETGGTL